MDYTQFINNMTMTLAQCRQQYQMPPEVISAIGVLLGISLLFALWIIHDLINCQKFIRENKLQKQFQQFKKDNKGL